MVIFNGTFDESKRGPRNRIQRQCAVPPPSDPSSAGDFLVGLALTVRELDGRRFAQASRRVIFRVHVTIGRCQLARCILTTGTVCGRWQRATTVKRKRRGSLTGIIQHSQVGTIR